MSRNFYYRRWSNWRPGRLLSGTKFLREFIFADWRLFVFCRSSFLRFWESTHYPEVIIFSLLLSMCNRNTRYAYPITSNSMYTVLFLNEARTQVVIKETWFRSIVFLCSEFKSEKIYSGVNFCGKKVCGNFYLRELILRIAGKIAKISCNTLFNFRCPGVEGV